MAQVIEIHDFSDPALDVYARATENQLVNRADPANALFIAESPLVIGRALDAGCVPVSFLMEPQHITGKGAEILGRCDPDLPVYTASLEVLTQLTGFHLTRGMLCAMRRPPLPSVAEVCARARRIAVLENVMNPTNVGAIFRCAAALGMDAVLLTTEGSDPLYRRASRVSMGNVFLVPWTYLPEGDWTAALHDLGFTTAAMALREDSLRLDDPRLLSGGGAGHRGRRAGRRHHRPMRPHGDDPHDPWGGQPECSCRGCRSLLPVGPAMPISEYKYPPGSAGGIHCIYRNLSSSRSTLSIFFTWGCSTR